MCIVVLKQSIVTEIGLQMQSSWSIHNRQNICKVVTPPYLGLVSSSISWLLLIMQAQHKSTHLMCMELCEQDRSKTCLTIGYSLPNNKWTADFSLYGLEKGA
jgi:hypothetical protein